jgi:pimeloyl-ACP methyl ester carboxylesterase
MTPKVPPPVSVRGGSNGVEAHCAEIVAMARRFGNVATDTGGGALRLHAYLADPVVGATAVLDPVGAATFEADLLDALEGPRGLSWVALQCGLIDTELRAAAAAYQQADHLDTTLRDHVGGLVQLRPARSPEAMLTDDPAVVDALMNAGLISLDGVVAGRYPDGRARLTAHGIDADPAATTPPRSLADVLAGLARRNAAEPGAVDVRIVTGADGTRRAIVDIPGTKTFDPTKVSDITGPSTNLRALVGVPTSYEQGVLQAMHRAGVRPGDDVMLVGHSEGGMVAVETAAACAASKRFHVTHVVTAGAPIGLTAGRLPPSVQVLALENHNDVVPHLDGRTNPDRTNITTVTINRGNGTIGTDHSVAKSYVPGAADVDASSDPSVRSFLSGARGFLRGATVQTNTFTITRQS